MFSDASTPVPAIGCCAKQGAQRVCTALRFRYAKFCMHGTPYIPATAVAVEISRGLGTQGFPHAHDWNLAPAARFSCDWRGENDDPGRETEVRLLWSNEFLYLRFRCRYRTLTVFADSDGNGRRDHLSDGDVAEVFLH